MAGQPEYDKIERCLNFVHLCRAVFVALLKDCFNPTPVENLVLHLCGYHFTLYAVSRNFCVIILICLLILVFHSCPRAIPALWVWSFIDTKSVSQKHIKSVWNQKQLFYLLHIVC